MSAPHPTTPDKTLQDSVETLLALLNQEPALRLQDATAVQSALHKAIAPTFEIVFAGAFSAGKSMLINALLERELLYSAEGHATGTECYIAYAEPDQERVVLTFASVAELQNEVTILLERLGVKPEVQVNLDRPEVIEKLQDFCTEAIQKEGGETRSARAKQAKALSLLLSGWLANRDRIQPQQNAIYSMDHFNFSTLKEAAAYARRGSNSAVLKKIEYYCHHPLLEDGNILIDLPGIDAPIKKDAQLTYDKIADPETSAVIAVLKPAATGEMTSEETELLELTRSNLGIRDRVFYVFNRIDETWYNVQLRQRLEDLLASQFRDVKRIFKTSGLLGFYGSQLKTTQASDRFGLDTLFVETHAGNDEPENTPQFVYEFNRYCSSSGKLPATRFRISVNNYETQNQNYVRILSEWGDPLIDRLIQDSGIEDFRTSMTRYLTEEKRPQLFTTLANDLQPVCMALRQLYLTHYRELDSQPQEVEGIKAKRIELLNQDLLQVSQALRHYFEQEVNQVVTNHCANFEEDFRRLKVKMVSRLDELLQTFSVEAAYRRATLAHPRNSTAPLLAILVEAFYYLSNELEAVLVEEIERIISNLFGLLIDRLHHQEAYRTLCQLIGDDAGLDQSLQTLETSVRSALRSAASTECDRYVREGPDFYREDTPFFYQLRLVIQQTSMGYDCAPMVEAEPAIRQLLKLDFEPKVTRTIQSTFRQAVNQTLKTHLLPMAEQYEQNILANYAKARSHLEATLDREAQAQLLALKEERNLLGEKIETYNEAVKTVNDCFANVGCDVHELPSIDVA